MHARVLMGLAAVAALNGAATAQAPPLIDRSVRQAVELTALRAHEIEEALLAAQMAGTVGIDMATAEVRRALEQAQRAGRLDYTTTLDQARAAAEEARLSMALMEPELHAARAAIELMGTGPGARAWGARLDDLQPEFRSLPQDPADSLYRAGRERLNRKEWEAAAALFRRIHAEERFARSGYRPDAYYWEAFALAQRGTEEDLRRAREALRQMQATYRESTMLSDATALAARIDGRLAGTGDARAAENLYRLAELEARSRGRGRQESQCPQDEQDDVRIAALSALLNVDSDRTVPVLREVMQRRDPCSVDLRRRALMLISRSRDPEAASVLADAARNDPDESVREQAVLFLGTIRTPEANQLLQSMLRESDDVAIQRRALMALTQQGGAEATSLLRDFAARENIPADLRRQAILLLMSRRRGGIDESGPFLRQLYSRTPDTETRTIILQALMQDRSEEGVDWLMGIALDTSQPAELRRQALFLAGQSEYVAVDRLVRLYDQATDDEMKEQILFTLVRREEPAAFDKLVSIARSDQSVEIRRRAIFWLGRSRDPRAPEVLLELIR